jgi:hypothetical protein
MTIKNTFKTSKKYFLCFLIINYFIWKLYNQLNKIKDEVVTNDFKITVKNINEESLKIEDKYNDYINNKNTQKKVEECISNIYDTKKEEARIIFNNFIKMDEIKDGY